MQRLLEIPQEVYDFLRNFRLFSPVSLQSRTRTKLSQATRFAKSWKRRSCRFAKPSLRADFCNRAGRTSAMS